jgi:hypothetical protein
MEIIQIETNNCLDRSPAFFGRTPSKVPLSVLRIKNIDETIERIMSEALTIGLLT